MFCDAKTHYDLLIDEGDDPVFDAPSLRAYMDGWDGAFFVERVIQEKPQTVLEIGVGTGRLALRIAPVCARFYGVDISPKTVVRAKDNLRAIQSVTLLCADFLEWETEEKFDAVYSSLTFFHIQDKEQAVRKVANLLRLGGRFVLSIDKAHGDILELSSRKVRLYPDTPAQMQTYLQNAGLTVLEKTETERAHIFVSEKQRDL